MTRKRVLIFLAILVVALFVVIEAWPPESCSGLRGPTISAIGSSTFAPGCGDK